MYEKNLMLVSKDPHKLPLLKLSVGLGTSLPLAAKSHCLPSSFLAPFKVHQDQMVVLGKAKREETNQPRSKYAL